MAILFRVIFILLVLWLLRRFLGSVLVASKQPPPKEKFQDTPNNMVRDPVCGMYMDSRLALRLDDRKEAFYFCSEECKNKFLRKSAKKEETRTAPRV